MLCAGCDAGPESLHLPGRAGAISGRGMEAKRILTRLWTACLLGGEDAAARRLVHERITA